MALRVINSGGQMLAPSGGNIRYGSFSAAPSGGGSLSVANPFEEELKRRMALARQQGWSDEEINRSALIERGIQRNNAAIQAAQQKQQKNQEVSSNIQKNKPSGWKRFGINAAALLGSTAAGIGAVAAAPFTGGASLVAGFGAGAGIEALRRRALGEEQNLGASLLEGGLTIIPGVGKAVGGVKAARAAKLANSATDAAQIARGVDRTVDAGRVVQQAGNATRAVNAGEAAERIAAIDRRIAMANRVGGLDANEARALLQEKQSLQMLPKPNNPAVIDATQRTAEIVPKKQTVIGNVKEQFTPNNEGYLFKKGTKMRGNSRGVTPGAGYRGDILTLEDSQAINKTIDDTFKQLGIRRPASAEKQLETIVEARRSIGKQMGDAVLRDNIPFDDAAKTTLGERLRSGLDEIVDFDPNKKAHVDMFNNYARRVDKATDMRQLEKERKFFDTSINFNRNANTPDPLKEQVARAFRDSIDEFVTDASPVSKELKGQFRRLKQAEQFMTSKGNLRPKGFQPFGTSVNGRGIGGEAVQFAGDAGGKLMQTASKIFSRPATKQLMAQYGLRVLAGTDSVNPNQPMTTEQAQQLMQAETEAAQGFSVDNAFNDPQSNDEAMLNEIFNSGATDFESVANGLADLENGLNNPAAGGDVAAAEANPFGFTREDLLTAAGQIVNDPTLDTKTQGYLLDNIKDLNQLLNDYDKVKLEEQKLAGKTAGEGGLNVTKVTAQQYGLAQSGAQALQNLNALLQKDPGVVGRSATPGRGLNIVGGFISNAAGTGDFDAYGYNIADTILRLRTGATANESEVRKLQSQIMPRAGDSQQTIQTKMKQIEEIFNGVLTMAQQTPTTPDFSDFNSLFGGGGGMDFTDPYQYSY